MGALARRAGSPPEPNNGVRNAPVLPGLPSDELKDGDRRVMSCDGTEVGVFKVDGQLVAWHNECPHRSGPVCQGRMYKRVLEPIDGDGHVRALAYDEHVTNIVCSWHGYEFDLKTASIRAATRSSCAGSSSRKRTATSMSSSEDTHPAARAKSLAPTTSTAGSTATRPTFTAPPRSWWRKARPRASPTRRCPRSSPRRCGSTMPNPSSRIVRSGHRAGGRGDSDRDRDARGRLRDAAGCASRADGARTVVQAAARRKLAGRHRQQSLRTKGARSKP